MQDLQERVDRIDVTALDNAAQGLLAGAQRIFFEAYRWPNTEREVAERGIIYERTYDVCAKTGMVGSAATLVGPILIAGMPGLYLSGGILLATNALGRLTPREPR